MTERKRTEHEAEVLATLLGGFAYGRRVFMLTRSDFFDCTGCAIEHDEHACDARPPGMVCASGVMKEVPDD